MTITFNNSYTEAVVASNLIGDWIIAGDNNVELKLTVSFACSETPVEIVINDYVDTDTQTYTLTPEDIGQTDVFSDGIYFSYLTLNNTQETECSLVNLEIECSIQEYLSNNLKSNIGALFESLKSLSKCSDCRCTDACLIYEYITSILNQQTTSDCGCS